MPENQWDFYDQINFVRIKIVFVSEKFRLSKFILLMFCFQYCSAFSTGAKRENMGVTSLRVANVAHSVSEVSCFCGHLSGFWSTCFHLGNELRLIP